MADIDAVTQELTDFIDETVSPGKMSKREAHEVLQRLHEHAGSSLDALDDEIAEEDAENKKD